MCFRDIKPDNILLDEEGKYMYCFTLLSSVSALAAQPLVCSTEKKMKRI